MANLDEDYVQELSDDDLDAHQVSRGSRSKPKPGTLQARGGAEWEVARTWETLVEGADGTINSAVEGLLEAGKKKRYSRGNTCCYARTTH